MAPFTPFICEEIYQTHFRKNEEKVSIHLESWPEVLEIETKESDEKIWNRFLEIVSLIRQKKSEEKKSMKAETELTLSKEDLDLLDSVLEDLKAVSNSLKIDEGNFEIKIL
jgi:valyl-tRNA synthetase